MSDKKLILNGTSLKFVDIDDVMNKALKAAAELRKLNQEQTNLIVEAVY